VSLLYVGEGGTLNLLLRHQAETGGGGFSGEKVHCVQEKRGGGTVLHLIGLKEKKRGRSLLSGQHNIRKGKAGGGGRMGQGFPAGEATRGGERGHIFLFPRGRGRGDLEKV